MNGGLDISGATMALEAEPGALADFKKGDKLTAVSATDPIVGSFTNTGQAIPVASGVATGDMLLVAASPDSFDLQYLGLDPAATGLNAHALLGFSPANALLLGEAQTNVVDYFGRQALLPDGPQGIGAFASAHGAHLRGKTGSHVDADGFDFAAGLEYRRAGWFLAAFAEAGWGNYSSYNSFPLFSTQGDGHNNFYGGGAYARADLPVGLYAEASGRVGRVDGSFNSGYINNVVYDFDTGTAYYGAHGGLGWLIPAGLCGTVDAYGKVFWTRQGSEDVWARAGEQLQLDAADSLRSRLGARYAHRFAGTSGTKWLAYAGGAWEYEFDGEQEGWYVAGANRARIDPTSLKGSSGLAELGVAAEFACGWRAEANLYGVFGRREGIGGSLGVSKGF